MFSLPGNPDVNLGYEGLKVIIFDPSPTSDATTILNISPEPENESEAFRLVGKFNKLIKTGKTVQIRDQIAALEKLSISTMKAPA